MSSNEEDVQQQQQQQQQHCTAASFPTPALDSEGLSKKKGRGRPISQPPPGIPHGVWEEMTYQARHRIRHKLRKENPDTDRRNQDESQGGHSSCHDPPQRDSGGWEASSQLSRPDMHQARPPEAVPQPAPSAQPESSAEHQGDAGPESGADAAALTSAALTPEESCLADATPKRKRGRPPKAPPPGVDPEKWYKMPPYMKRKVERQIELERLRAQGLVRSDGARADAAPGPGAPRWAEDSTGGAGDRLPHRRASRAEVADIFLSQCEHSIVHSCPQNVAKLADMLVQRPHPSAQSEFDKSGRWWYEGEIPITNPYACMEDFQPTALIMWDPPTTFRHLFGGCDVMPCPRHGWGDVMYVNPAGWETHGPRRVFDLDRCIWLCARRYACALCREEGCEGLFPAYDPASMAMLSRKPAALMRPSLGTLDLGFVAQVLPVFVARRGAVTTRLLEALMAAPEAGLAYEDATRLVQQMHLSRRESMKEQFIMFQRAIHAVHRFHPDDAADSWD